MVLTKQTGMGYDSGVLAKSRTGIDTLKYFNSAKSPRLSGFFVPVCVRLQQSVMVDRAVGLASARPVSVGIGSINPVVRSTPILRLIPQKGGLTNCYTPTGEHNDKTPFSSRQSRLRARDIAQNRTANQFCFIPLQPSHIHKDGNQQAPQTSLLHRQPVSPEAKLLSCCYAVFVRARGSCKAGSYTSLTASPCNIPLHGFFATRSRLNIPLKHFRSFAMSLLTLLNGCGFAASGGFI